MRLRNATEILATGVGNVRDRLGPAITDELVLANVPDDPDIPQYFRTKQAEIVGEMEVHACSAGDNSSDAFPIEAGFTHRIWKLYNEFEEYCHSGFIPYARH